MTRKEVQNLIEWKESAMRILTEIDLQAIGNELNLPLGSSVSENLLNKIKLHTEKNRIEGVLVGLKICKEMWGQGTLSHENIYENEIMYKEELENLNESETPQLNIGVVRRSYSLDEVREIALEYRNACMYGHSHKLTRFELQAELRKIDEKHGLDYKEGFDYNFA